MPKIDPSSGRHIELSDFVDDFPAAGDSTAVVVCGTDGFLETVCGGHVRVAVEGRKKKKKLQGPLKGLLREAGFESAHVTKL